MDSVCIKLYTNCSGQLVQVGTILTVWKPIGELSTIAIVCNITSEL